MAIDRTIISLAILKVNWDKKRVDYIENFVPFIATLINKKKYTDIVPETVLKDFSDEFGMSIPHEPMLTILERCTKRGIIKKNHRGTALPVWDKIAKLDFSDRQLDQERRQNRVFNELQIFIKEHFNTDISKEDIEEILIEYFRQHDIDILFSAFQKSLLPEVKADKKKKFFVYKFIQSCSENGPEVFGYIVDLAIGHILANCIVYEQDYRNYQGKLTDLNVYLDIQFLIHLSGVEGEVKAQNILHFINGIIEKGGRVKVFQHTYDEALGVLNGAKLWINKRTYDKSRANITTQFFVENSKTDSDVDICISQLQTLLKRIRVEIEVAPDRDELRKYLISEQELNDKIIAVYKKCNPNFKEEGREIILYKDITSISSIYILRRNEKPRNIKNARYIFVTTNSALAHAARMFEKNNYPGIYLIPACLTHVFLGTAIWLDSPVNLLKFNKMKMISDCIAALTPSRDLIKQYLNEVEKIHKAGRINDDQFYYMKSDKWVYNLLETKTYGAMEYFYEKTAEEILQETLLSEKAKGSAELERLKKDDEASLQREKEAHLKTQHELQSEVDDKNLIITMNLNIAKTISKVISNSVYLTSIVFILLGILSAPPFEIVGHGFLEILFISIGSVFILLHIVNGIYVIKIKKNIEQKTFLFIMKLLTGR